MSNTDIDKVMKDLLPWLASKMQDKNQDLNPGTELITQNLLDSMEFLELVSYLEEKYNIELDPDVLTPENFKTPTDIARMVCNTIN